MDTKTMSCENFLRSVEKIESKDNDKKKDESVSDKNKNKYIETKDLQKKTKTSLISKLNELPGKADTVNKKCHLWARNRTNLVFYKKYLDRVRGGLYDRYGSEAEVKENNMIDDPVTILKGPAKAYIHDVVEDINKLYNELSELSKKLENKSTAEQCIAVVERYCKDYVGQKKNGENREDEKTSWKTKIDEATKYKIARILLRNGDRSVYGYTSKSMVLKGFPTPNHLIVTLFVNNPEESPTIMPVTEVFKSVDSFDLLASSDKEDVFNVANMSKSVLEKTADNKVLNEIANYRSNAISKFKQVSIDNKIENGKIIDQIWDGVKLSMKEILSKKNYLIDCINVYFDMVLRIDKLAVLAIKDMLAVENKYRDKKYDKNLKVSHSKDVGNLSSRNEKDNSGKSYNHDSAKNLHDIAKKLNR